MRRTFLLFVFLLCGCASHINQSSLNDKKGLPAGEGVVAVQVVNNAYRLSKYVKNWNEVIAVRIDNIDELKAKAIADAKKKANGKEIDKDKVEWEPDAYSMRASTLGVLGSQLYVGSMPAGKYIITELFGSYDDGNVSAWISMPVGVMAGHFQVVANHFSDLGTLVFQPLASTTTSSFWLSKSRQRAYVVPLGDQELTPFLRDEYPHIAKEIDQKPLGGWIKDPFDGIRHQLAQLARTNAVGFKAVGLSDNHFIGAITARLGQLRLLDDQGHWQRVDLPTNGQLTSVLSLSDFIVIGAERGQVFISHSGHAPWHVLQPIPATQAVVWMGAGKDSNYALAESNSAFYVYRFRAVTDTWQQIGHFTRKPRSELMVQNGGLFAAITHQGQLRVFNDDKMLDFQPKTNSWKSSKGTSLLSLEQTKNGTLLALGVSQWSGIGDQMFSQDDGNSWQTIDRDLTWFGDNVSKRSLPTLMEDGTLASLGRVYVHKKHTELKVLYRNINSKGRWQIGGAVKDGCETMLPELTQGKQLYFLCDRGQVVETSDFGKTWRTVVNIDSQKMQEKFDNLLKEVNK